MVDYRRHRVAKPDVASPGQLNEHLLHIVGQFFGLVGIAEVEGCGEQGRAKPFVRDVQSFGAFAGGNR